MMPAGWPSDKYRIYFLGVNLSVARPHQEDDHVMMSLKQAMACLRCQDIKQEQDNETVVFFRVGVVARFWILAGGRCRTPEYSLDYQ